MDKIIESKRAYREMLARLPIAEKLRMLDDLRERTLEIRKAGEAWEQSQRDQRQV